MRISKSYTLFGCLKFNKPSKYIDSKSYINDFELLQENPNNQTSIKITSPKAIVNYTNNDVEIFNSSIELINKNGDDFVVESGNSTFNNLSNTIQVFNDVKISFLDDNDDYFITTNSLSWDLNNSLLDINKTLYINYDNTNIIANEGLYNINSNIFKIVNSNLIRNIYKPNGQKDYQINIKSDFAKWLKHTNTLVFSSNDKPVQTTINFLTTK